MNPPQKLKDGKRTNNHRTFFSLLPILISLPLPSPPLRNNPKSAKPKQPHLKSTSFEKNPSPKFHSLFSIAGLIDPNSVSGP